jgi:hypothetical protein
MEYEPILALFQGFEPFFKARIWIRIRIRMISRIRIRIKVRYTVRYYVKVLRSMTKVDYNFYKFFDQNAVFF